MDEATRHKLVLLDWMSTERDFVGETGATAGELEQAKQELLTEPVPVELAVMLRLVAFVEKAEREAAAAYLESTGAPAAAKALRDSYHRRPIGGPA